MNSSMWNGWMWHSWKISLQMERSMMSRRFVRYSVRRCASCCELGGGKMNRQGQERAQILYAFGLSLVFVLIDWMVFTLLVEPLYQWLPIEPAWLCNAVHLTLLSLTGTLLGCLLWCGGFAAAPGALGLFVLSCIRSGLCSGCLAWAGRGKPARLPSNWSASIRLPLQLSAWRFPGHFTSGLRRRKSVKR